MKFEDQIASGLIAGIAHAMRLPGSVVDRATGANSLAQGFDAAGEDEDSHIVFVFVSRVAGTRLQIGDMRMQLTEIGRGIFEEAKACCDCANRARSCSFWRSCSARACSSRIVWALGLSGCASSLSACPTDPPTPRHGLSFSPGQSPETLAQIGPAP
jgi:hypothetical protein